MVSLSDSLRPLATARLAHKLLTQRYISDTKAETLKCGLCRPVAKDQEDQLRPSFLTEFHYVVEWPQSQDPPFSVFQVLGLKQMSPRLDSNTAHRKIIACITVRQTL